MTDVPAAAAALREFLIGRRHLAPYAWAFPYRWLQGLGPDAAELVPLLLELARAVDEARFPGGDERTNCERFVVRALGDVHARAEDVVPVLAERLVRHLGDESPVALACVEGLGAFGAAAAPAEDALLRAMSDHRSADVREAAEKVLKALTSGDPRVRLEALLAATPKGAPLAFPLLELRRVGTPSAWDPVERRFREQLAARPDDRATRLVFEDWQQEQPSAVPVLIELASRVVAGSPRYPRGTSVAISHIAEIVRALGRHRREPDRTIAFVAEQLRTSMRVRSTDDEGAPAAFDLAAACVETLSEYGKAALPALGLLVEEARRRGDPEAARLVAQLAPEQVASLASEPMAEIEAFIARGSAATELSFPDRPLALLAAYGRPRPGEPAAAAELLLRLADFCRGTYLYAITDGGDYEGQDLRALVPVVRALGQVAPRGYELAMRFLDDYVTSLEQSQRSRTGHLSPSADHNDRMFDTQNAEDALLDACRSARGSLR